MLRKVFNEFSWEDSESTILVREKSMWIYQLPRLFQHAWAQSLIKLSFNISLLSAHTFSPIWTMLKSDNSDSENCADSQLSFIVLSSDNLRHSAMDSWVFPFLFILKGGGGWGSISEDSALWIDFCFALSFAAWLCQMQCVSHAVSLFREPWLGWLVSIQKQAKEDKILLSGLLRLQISN